MKDNIIWIDGNGNRDADSYNYEINEYKRKLNMLSEQIIVYEGVIEGHKAENKLLTKKLESAVKDSENIRTIMTNSIIQSNAREQALLQEISQLRNKNN